ncbi:MAG: alpha/beta hydrolase [Anaerolineae bacterium]
MIESQKLQRITDLVSEDGHTIPAYGVVPDKPTAGIAVCHGYGGVKEGMLGLCARLAEHGFAAVAFDLRGHGENDAPIGPGVALDFSAAVENVRRFGPAFAAGHSLGGRLSFTVGADAAVAISPAVVQEISPQGQWMFENFPSPTVREPYSGYVVELLDELGEVPDETPPAIALVGQNDIISIYEGAHELAHRLPQVEVHVVELEQRPLVESGDGLVRYLPRWLNHSQLKTNTEVLRIAPGWLTDRIR